MEAIQTETAVPNRLAALRERISAGRDASGTSFSDFRKRHPSPTDLVTDELRAGLAKGLQVSAAGSDDILPSPGLPIIGNSSRQK